MVDKGIIERKLKANNYKLTPQRRAIIDALFEHRGGSSQPGNTLQNFSRHSGTDFSTVYRNLEILEKMGIIHKTNKGGRRLRAHM